MVADCHTCGTPLDDQEIIDAGMECICHSCWDKRWKSSREEYKEKEVMMCPVQFCPNESMDERNSLCNHHYNL